MPKIAFSLKTQLFSYTCIRHNCLEQDSSALFLDHFFPLLTFIQVPWALIWSELSSVWPVLLVVSWLPAGGSERGADWLPSNQSWYLNRDGAKVWKSPNLCVELKLIKGMSKGQLVTRKAEGFRERMVASGGVPWEHRHQPCTSSPLTPPSLWVVMSSCDSMCLTADTLLFLIFFSKTNLEGVRHLGYALTTKWMVFGQRLPGVFLTFGFFHLWKIRCCVC